jgi:DNA modification methylase
VTWGLRDYGLEPTVWGGDADHAHEWGSIGPGHHPGQVPDGKAVTDENAVGQNAGSGRNCACGAWLGTLGLEPTPELFVEHLVGIFRELRRVLRKDGTVWCNLGDNYAANGTTGGGGPVDKRTDGRNTTPGDKVRGRNPERKNVPPGLKPKDLMMMPARVALALQADGWWLRSDIIWSKPNPMPESVRDRFTQSHEHVFLLAKSATYFMDMEAIREDGPSYTRKAGGYHGRDGNNASRFGGAGGFGDSDVTTTGRNKRTVWEIATEPYPDAHFATFPQALVEPCVLAGTSERGVCAECGAPWERVVEKTQRYDHVTTDPGKSKQGPYSNQTGDGAGTHDVRHGVYVDTKTTGWSPTCSCPGLDGDGPWLDPTAHPDGVANWPTVPATCLDLFAGSGTVGVVAQKLGRRAVLIDASADYLALARRRIEAISLPMELNI